MPIQTSVPLKEMKSNGFTNMNSNKRLSNLTKSKVNMKLLKQYNWKIEKRINEKGSEATIYICQYENWRREFTRTWSIIDHVRMHEGVRPYTCKHWGRTYTQKGNMLKHMRRHNEKGLEKKKKFNWELWHRGYTEKYNLKVSFIKYLKPKSVL